VFHQSFCEAQGGGSRGTDGRGAGHRRMRPSPVGRCGVEEEGALAGEAMGGGGRGRSPVVGRHGA
jgi:hypothetical protein